MPPFNSTLPYSVYAVTDKNSGGTGANEDLATTLANGNSAGNNDINMNQQNILHCNNIDVNIINAVTAVRVGVPETIRLTSATGDITCNDITANDVACSDFTSTGTLTYNILNPSIPAFQPSSFSTTGNLTGTNYASSLGYDFTGMIAPVSFSEAPPLPALQPTFTPDGGLYANGMSGWYRFSINCFPTLPAFDYFITINVIFKVFSNSTGTNPAIQTTNFTTNISANNITTFVVSNSFVVEMLTGYSAKWEFNCTTQSNNTYQMIGDTQISGELISKGV